LKGKLKNLKKSLQRKTRHCYCISNLIRSD
jgi:hypothetical protein